jgi:competence protein ComEA
MQIRIPNESDTSLEAENFIYASAQVAENSSSLININTASQKELETLPNIGPAIARYIVDFREENGFFSSIEDIKKVSRIGDVTFDRIKDSITVK